jgi:hypothetical protein
MKKKFIFFLIGIILIWPAIFGLKILERNLEQFFYAQIGKFYEEMNLVKIEKIKKPSPELNVK